MASIHICFQLLRGSEWNKFHLRYSLILVYIWIVSLVHVGYLGKDILQQSIGGILTVFHYGADSEGLSDRAILKCQIRGEPRLLIYEEIVCGVWRA